MTFAVFQTMLTSLSGASPEPESVNVLPASPMSGFAVRMPIVAEAVAGAASGPGIAATPGMAGGVSGAGVARAGADRSRAPVSTAPMREIVLVLVLMVSSRFRCFRGCRLRARG